MKFEDFGLAEPLLDAVRKEGYTNPTPIQQKAIPHLMSGKDISGCAQTGTGKTAAFALPILHRLAAEPSSGKRHIRTLVLTPTRELAAQVSDSFKVYGKNLKLKTTAVYGGVNQNTQKNALNQGIDILVATPGRLIDLMQQGCVRLDHVESFVLDEADRMLDMGFIDDVRRIVKKLPDKRQTMMFSATMAPTVRRLADSLLTDPVSVSITPEAPAAETINQAVYFVDHCDKNHLLIHLLEDAGISRALIFTRTKYRADKVARHLIISNIAAEAIHSNKSQNARTRALDSFKCGKTRVLVASDIAARGLDVDDISHVINYDLPQEPEVYVHRIGRTGRAGAEGIAFTFCDSNERQALDIIEKLIHVQIPTIVEHPWHSPIPMAQQKRPAQAIRSNRRPNTSGRPSGQSRRPAPAVKANSANAQPDHEKAPSHKTTNRRRRRPKGKSAAVHAGSQNRGNAQSSV